MKNMATNWIRTNLLIRMKESTAIVKYKYIHILFWFSRGCWILYRVDEKNNLFENLQSYKGFYLHLYNIQYTYIAM